MPTNHAPRHADDLGPFVQRISRVQPPREPKDSVWRRIRRRVPAGISAEAYRLGIMYALVIATIGWVGVKVLRPARAVTTEAVASGRTLFLHQWQPNDPLRASGDALVASAGDGLGPVFNARSCVACHFQGGVGGAGRIRQNVLAFDVVATKTNPQFHAGVIHAFATADINLESTADVLRMFPRVQGEQRKIQGCLITLPEFDPVSFASINAPALFGLGQLDSISDKAITALQQRRQRELYGREIRGDFSGTPSGRARVLPGGRVGRFGWKAQFATLEDFVASACAVEIGLSNPKRRQDRPHYQGEDRDAPLDISADQLFQLTAYVGALPTPVRTLPESSSARALARRGERLFASVGCTDCHTPSVGQVVGLYSDLLLHKLEENRDLGPYSRVNPDLPPPEDSPLANEWRTAPLWGVADTAPYFHDGESPTLEAAILRHGLQAARVTERYRLLSADDQRAVIRFLKTLKTPAWEPVSQDAGEAVAAR
ncbi:MAG: di-heme oxidoredictase family protein [Planctomycetaceae bacterium]